MCAFTELQETIALAYELAGEVLQESEFHDDITDMNGRNAAILKAFKMLDAIDTMFNGNDTTDPIVRPLGEA